MRARIRLKPIELGIGAVLIVILCMIGNRTTKSFQSDESLERASQPHLLMDFAPQSTFIFEQRVEKVFGLGVDRVIVRSVGDGECFAAIAEDASLFMNGEEVNISKVEWARGRREAMDGFLLVSQKKK